MVGFFRVQLIHKRWTQNPDGQALDFTALLPVPPSPGSPSSRRPGLQHNVTNAFMVGADHHGKIVMKPALHP